MAEQFYFWGPNFWNIFFSIFWWSFSTAFFFLLSCFRWGIFLLSFLFCINWKKKNEKFHTQKTFSIHTKEEKIYSNTHIHTKKCWVLIKQGDIKYHFLSLWYDSTWNWTPVSRTIGKHYSLGQWPLVIVFDK